MFCPECGTLAFPDSSGLIKCLNYECSYHGEATIPEVVYRIGNGIRTTDPESYDCRCDWCHERTRSSPTVEPAMELIERLSKIRRVEPTDINKAFFDEWREMKEGWSYGMTRYDVHQYGDGSG